MDTSNALLSSFQWVGLKSTVSWTSAFVTVIRIILQKFKCSWLCQSLCALKELAAICLAYMVQQWTTALVFASSTWSYIAISLSRPNDAQLQCSNGNRCFQPGMICWHLFSVPETPTNNRSKMIEFRRQQRANAHLEQAARSVNNNNWFLCSKGWELNISLKNIRSTLVS